MWYDSGMKLISVLLLSIVATVASASGDAEHGAFGKLVGVWHGSYSDTAFTIVLYPTKDYQFEMYDRVVKQGTWDYDVRSDGPSLVLLFTPDIHVSVAEFHVGWVSDDEVCVASYHSSAITNCITLRKE